ncbi:hypothetical protein [Motilimonas sp. E26]|uniref:hypothetical protein n=1 Tax=Motilimonas sp. E26 TaxID=2865674 RepID=UPI001E555BE2|nr:hypothetical protein [Motilimonas sp. E26]MCE0556215.1 hypothetical protein [Motilimonas sp. E26]
MIDLWREHPNVLPCGESVANENIFASGRQAIQQSMLDLNLTRVSRIAFPEFSSACVISCLGRIATPIPMAEVVRYDMKVDAILIYEQWGWPLPASVIESVKQYSDYIIVDAVDSPDALIRYSNVTDGYTCISLYKCLGLALGGLLSYQGKLQVVKNGRTAPCPLTLDNVLNVDIAKSYYNNIDLIQPDIQGDLIQALAMESKARQKNLSRLAEIGLFQQWPLWMHKVVEYRSGAPGIAPLFHSETAEFRMKKQLKLAQLGIKTALYNFNFSGSPIAVDYRPCLAFPLHSELVWSDRLKDILQSGE